jgi:hypothetical protein
MLFWTASTSDHPNDPVSSNAMASRGMEDRNKKVKKSINLGGLLDQLRHE